MKHPQFANARAWIVAAVAALTLGLATTATANPAKPIALVQAERIALRWGQHLAADRVVALWVSDCHRGRRADYAICTVNLGDADVTEHEPVVIWRLPHGYAVRLQEPTLFISNPVWLTR